ncbi:hypothetical protein [Candidatus Leptofilum sp.]|uniref:hypothetical protein n=1 Tax=Candidatus Leptofilum sp. TaxID=3241576 RepID=UPI003B5A820B
MLATSSGSQVKDVPLWRYRIGNVGAAREHYWRSCIIAEETHSTESLNQRIEIVENWLEKAAKHAEDIEEILGYSRMTRTEHVRAWHEAFVLYREDHNV